MLIPGESFPYTPLSHEQRQAVLVYCGGAPIKDPQYLRNFLTTSGYPLIGAFRSYFVGSLAQKSVSALDMGSHDGVRAFNRGALFYSGVLGVANGLGSLPLDETVLSTIGDADGQNFALESYQALHLEAPSFCELTEEVRPALGTHEDDRLHQLALVGAGAVHLMVVRSTDKLMDASAEALTAAHPELADLHGL